ncbi:hypothetical protein OAL10_12780, partial [Gammaproteobacteria bacterium]|nr:hypothetical protein [Gammaproteobacteria bacterium]
MHHQRPDRATSWIRNNLCHRIRFLRAVAGGQSSFGRSSGKWARSFARLFSAVYGLAPFPLIRLPA